jgi:hypothetical protein
MGPNDFIRKPSRPGQPRPLQPASLRPRPAMDGFAPPSGQAHSPTTAPQRPLQHTQQQSQAAKTQADLKQQAEDYKNQKKQHRSSKLKKLFIVAGIPALILIGILVLVVFKGDSKKPVSQSHTAPLVPPEFTVYYPTPIPDGLSTTKNSIVYSKNSFSFILQQNGQNHFFVNEQPAATDPDFSILKGQIAGPKNLTTTIGPGVTGTVDGGTITAAMTNKNTLITINCVKITCAPLSEQILSSMQLNDSPDSIRRSNL